MGRKADTNIVSTFCHRLVFLPKIARVIMIGSIMDQTRKYREDWHRASFLEISKYFDSADSTFLKFIVESANTTNRTPNDDEDKSNVWVDLPRMEAFVRQALHDVETEHEWRVSEGW